MVEKILKEEKEYGTSILGKGVKVNNEFISANPTGRSTLGMRAADFTRIH